MMAMVEEKVSSNGKENYTQDGTVDLKGWKACSFIAGKMEPFAAYFEAD